MKYKKLSIKILLLLASVYFVSQFLRSALGITALSISEELNLNYEQIGRLGGVFFLSFALMQIPLGILLDRLNPLIVLTFMLLIIWLGTVLLAFANSYQFLIVARILQGIGCSACLMGPLIYLAKNSSKKYFSKSSGIIMGVGGLGALFSFSPFYMLNQVVGWQKSFFITSFLVLLIALLIISLYQLEKNNFIFNKTKQEFKVFLFIFSNKNFLRILPISIFGYASFAFLLTLWGSKFLTLKNNINEQDIGLILMIMALFWTLGSIFFGYINEKTGKNKTLVTLSTLAVSFLLVLLATIKTQSFTYYIIIFSIYGFLGAFTLVIIDQYRKLFDKDILGKVLTSANLFNFGGVFGVQWMTGFIIDYSTHIIGLKIEQGFSIAFLIIAIFLFISLLFYLKSDEE